MSLTRRVFMAAAGSAAASGAAVAAPAPRRIVSLNPCLDVVLTQLVEPSQIAALSHYSREQNSSSIAALARTLPITYESAEEIIALSPDLVLGSQHSGRATRNALGKVGIEVQGFAVANSIAESLDMVRRIASLTGRQDRGEQMIASIEAAIAAAAPPPGHRPIRALVFQPRGLVAGAGTLADEMLQKTGFENAAGRYGVAKWGNISLEAILADPPDLLLSPAAHAGAPSRAERVISHPALASIRHIMQRADFPEWCLYCGGPVLLKTAPILASARDNFRAAR